MKSKSPKTPIACELPSIHVGTGFQQFLSQLLQENKNGLKQRDVQQLHWCGVFFWGVSHAICYITNHPRSSKCKVKRPAYLAVKLNLNIPKTANQIVKENNQNAKEFPPSKWSSIRVPKSWECYSVIVPNSHGLSYQPLPMRPPPTGAPQCQTYPVEHLLGSLAPHDLARSPWCSELFPSNGRKKLIFGLEKAGWKMSSGLLKIKVDWLFNEDVSCKSSLWVQLQE